MTIDEVLSMADKKGVVVKPSLVDDSMCVVDLGPAPDTNERMRVTADGAVLIVDEGRYWQIGPIKDVYNWLKEKNA